MKKLLLTLIVIVSTIQFSTAQQTVGVFFNTPESFNGYTLFSPLSSTNTYLIDNCGHIVNLWQSSFTPGNAVYLLPNGNLLRTARINSGTFNGGGIGGRVEMFDWSNNLLWGYDYANSQYHQHHDVEYLPNGNILLIAWEYKSSSEAVALGRLTSGNLWPDKIVEITPVGTNDVEIVWEWHAWDHLVQDADPSKPNYGAISVHPERIDINYGNVGGGGGPGGMGGDWMHCNAISYNPEFDQIILNSRHFNEFWVIDHSTTTEEAAGSTGGNYGKGGDILYRWGNPEVYDRGNNNDQTLFGQHDVQWIQEGLPDAGKIMIFNNGIGRPNGNYSSVDVIEIPQNPDGSYDVPATTAFGPSDLFWTYANPGAFFSQNISGAHRLPNGNTLICEGNSGNIFEVDADGTMVWDYVNPVSNFGAVSQGMQPNGNSVFRAYRYGTDYGIFENIVPIPIEVIEQNPWPSDCEIYEESIGVQNTTPDAWLQISPNPVNEQLTLHISHIQPSPLQIFDVQGNLIYQATINANITTINTQKWAKGLYFVRYNQQYTRKFIKQ
jgi:hypothetical protein